MRSERSTKSLFERIILFIFSIIVVIIQIALYFFIINKVKNVNAIVIAMRVVGFLCVIDMFSNNMCSSYKLIWTIIILTFSFAGPILYLLFGNQRTFPQRKNRKINKYLNKYIQKDNKLLMKIKSEDLISYKHIMTINSVSNFPVYNNTNTRFYNSIDEKFNDMLDNIKKANKYIFIEYFVISSGVMLDKLTKALIEAQERNNNKLEIKIIYDDLGSKLTFKQKSFKELSNIPNLEIIEFAPLGINLNPAVNYRDHRKMVIIDGNIGYVGGDNLGDEYANIIKKYGKWRDNAIKLEGESVNSLVLLFAQTWYMSSKQMLDIENYQNKGLCEKSNCNCSGYVMPFGDGPTDDYNPAYDLYSSFANNSQKYLYISTPYFVIDQEFIENLCVCARSGVDVRILVPGIPDKKLVSKISESHYGKLLKEGVKVYKFTPGFNHAKNYISDDKYAVIGTINVDYRSLYLHFENGVYINDTEIVKEMKENFLNDLQVSEELTYNDFKKRNKLMKFLEFILRMFSPLL